MISLTSPVETAAHHWPAGLKLGALCLTTLTLFFVNQLTLQSVVLVAVMLMYMAPGYTFFKFGMRQLTILWPFITLLSIWHLYSGEYRQGSIIVLRMVSMVALANWVTMTTRLSDMMDLVHRLTRPLSSLGVNTRTLELGMVLVIRMTPVLIGKGQSLCFAWRARSTRRSGWRMIIPFTVQALDDADHVAEALRARGGMNPQEKH